ncbi:MAG: hypothetical protein JNL02_11750 [Saprospiraceae bacterium]|nr:hypothetical protein [Saprospiraceae bacterium]
MKNNLFFLSVLSLLAFLACRSNPQLREELYLVLPTTTEVRYSQADLHKLDWLSGAWTGKEAGRNFRILFQFHDDNSLEVFQFDQVKGSTMSLLSWHEGKYYFGTNRQWIVSWIGNKDVRFEPAVYGVEPMTFTRISDNQWHWVRHTAEGDEATLLERAEPMQP